MAPWDTEEAKRVAAEFIAFEAERGRTYPSMSITEIERKPNGTITHWQLPVAKSEFDHRLEEFTSSCPAGEAYRDDLETLGMAVLKYLTPEMTQA